MKGIIVFLSLVALAALVGLVAVGHFYAPVGLDLEIAKSLLEILTVAVVGQAVALTVKLHNDSRRKQAAADQIRYRALDTLNHTFVSAKRIRRRARARSTVLSPGEASEHRRITRVQYFKCLEQVNDIQLALEVLAKDIETRAGLFKEGRGIFRLVSSMEEYLNGLVDEWEHLNVPFTGQPRAVAVEQLARFADFIGPYRTSRFRPKFVHAYYEAVELLRASLADARSQSWKRRVQPGASA